MSTVWIPPVLRASAGGNKQVEVAGDTVGQLIDTLITTHPALASQIRTADGDLNRFINVYLNGQDIRYLGGEATAVLPTDEVRLLPAMAGGSLAGGSLAGGSTTAGPVRWSR
ncbi:MAG: ubiquitin-like small modifier protein 1 [Candidatus Limnocylindrales bacterium]|jgi:molybdopterin converting factor small subunit